MTSLLENGFCLVLDNLCMGLVPDTPKAIQDGDVVVEDRNDQLDEEQGRASRRPEGRTKVDPPTGNEGEAPNKSRANKYRDFITKKYNENIGHSWSGASGKKTSNSNKTRRSSNTSPKSDSVNNDKDKDYPTDIDTDLEEEGDIKAHVMMISGCKDAQTSADVSNVVNFSLPDPNGRAGGACTSALLKVLYNQKNGSSDLTFVQVLRKMRNVLRHEKYTQIPQLTSSKPVDIHQPFYIVPPNFSQGTKRAVLIGINYTGQQGELSGCHNDCLNMKQYLINVWGFEEENVNVLMDDGKHVPPTKNNILMTYQQMAAASKDGDVLFCHYSGHGGRIRDDDSWQEEEDGYDETLVPVDFGTAGQIRDDDLYTNLVCALDRGVTMVALFDCCHSGTVLDLPFKYKSVTTSPGGTFFSESTQCIFCADPQFPKICIIMIIVFCAIFFPLWFA